MLVHTLYVHLIMKLKLTAEIFYPHCSDPGSQIICDRGLAKIE